MRLLRFCFRCAFARLSRRRRYVPVYPRRNYIDAERHESVIRATLLRYTLKSRHVNILVCGFPLRTVEEAPPRLLSQVPTRQRSYSQPNYPTLGLGKKLPQLGFKPIGSTLVPQPKHVPFRMPARQFDRTSCVLFESGVFQSSARRSPPPLTSRRGKNR